MLLHPLPPVQPIPTTFGTQPISAQSVGPASTVPAHEPAVFVSSTSEFPHPSNHDDQYSRLEQEALSALARLGLVGLTPEDLYKLNASEDFEEELQLMAEVRAYFHLAYQVRQLLSARHVTA